MKCLIVFRWCRTRAEENTKNKDLNDLPTRRLEGSLGRQDWRWTGDPAMQKPAVWLPVHPPAPFTQVHRGLPPRPEAEAERTASLCAWSPQLFLAAAKSRIRNGKRSHGCGIAGTFSEGSEGRSERAPPCLSLCGRISQAGRLLGGVSGLAIGKGSVCGSGKRTTGLLCRCLQLPEALSAPFIGTRWRCPAPRAQGCTAREVLRCERRPPSPRRPRPAGQGGRGCAAS